MNRLLQRGSRAEVGWRGWSRAAPVRLGSVDSFTTAVIVDDDEFARLAEPWDRLVAGCGSSTPFQAHAWLNSWWRAYGTPGRLRVAVVYVEGELVGAAALYLSRRLPVRILSPVGVGVSDFCDVLVADTLGAERVNVVYALRSAICQVRGWDVIDLPEVRPAAAVGELAAVWSARSSSTPASTCLELRAQDLSDLVASLPGSTAAGRKTMRKKLRKLDQVGVTSRPVPVEDVPAAVAQFHRLHLAQWEGRGINPEHTRPRFRAFLDEALPLMVKRRQALVTEYHLGGELVGVVINVVNSSLLGGYLFGMSPVVRRHLDIGTLLLRDDMIRAMEQGAPVVSLLRGEEDYKFRWGPVPVQNRRVVLGRSGSMLALLHLASAEAQAKALPWLRQHAPWLKRLRKVLERPWSARR